MRNNYNTSRGLTEKRMKMRRHSKTFLAWPLSNTFQVALLFLVLNFLRIMWAGSISASWPQISRSMNTSINYKNNVYWGYWKSGNFQTRGQEVRGSIRPCSYHSFWCTATHWLLMHCMYLLSQAMLSLVLVFLACYCSRHCLHWTIHFVVCSISLCHTASSYYPLA